MSKKLAVIQGITPSGITIVGMVFTGFQEANDYVIRFLGEPDMRGTERGHTIAVWNTGRRFAVDPKLAKNFFTYYRDGDHDDWCDVLEISEINVGVPFNAFDFS